MADFISILKTLADEAPALGHVIDDASTGGAFAKFLRRTLSGEYLGGDWADELSPTAQKILESNASSETIKRMQNLWRRDSLKLFRDQGRRFGSGGRIDDLDNQSLAAGRVMSNLDIANRHMRDTPSFKLRVLESFAGSPEKAASELVSELGPQAEQLLYGLIDSGMSTKEASAAVRALM